MTHLLDDYQNGHVNVTDPWARAQHYELMSREVLRLDDHRRIYRHRRRLGTFVVELLFLYGLPVLMFLMFVLGLTGLIYIVLAIGRALRAIGGP